MPNKYLYYLLVIVFFTFTPNSTALAFYKQEVVNKDEQQCIILGYKPRYTQQGNYPVFWGAGAESVRDNQFGKSIKFPVEPIAFDGKAGQYIVPANKNAQTANVRLFEGHVLVNSSCTQKRECLIALMPDLTDPKQVEARTRQNAGIRLFNPDGC